MLWNEGFTGTYYITTVDPKTWRDIDRMEITGGTVERSTDGLLQSADLDMTELPDSVETWVRIWMDAEQGGVEHVALFTGLTSVPSRDLDGLRESYKVECYSVLKAVDDILLERGYYVPAEMTAPQAAVKLLSKGVAPVVLADVSRYPALRGAIIAEDDETALTMAEKVLEAIGWQIRIDGRGVIYVEPKSDEVVEIFDSEGNDVMELAITDERDWFSCPNVLRCISDDLTAIARDDDPDSPLSTVSRGREVWMQETSVKLGTSESLASYTARKLRELQSPARTATYARRFDPDIEVGNRVRINHPEISIDGVFEVTHQSLELGYGCRTSETAQEVING